MSLSNKGKKLVADNPKDTPKELLSKGLSQQDYEHLLNNPQKVQSVPEETAKPTVTVEPTPLHRAQPSLSMPLMTGSNFGDDQVILVGKDGKRTELSRTAAEMMVRKGNGQIE